MLLCARLFLGSPALLMQTTSQAVPEEDCGPLHASATCMPRPSLGIQYSDYNESRRSLTSPDTGQAVDLLAFSDLTGPVIQNKHLGPFCPPQVQLLGNPTAHISAVERSEGPFPYSLCKPHSVCLWRSCHSVMCRWWAAWCCSLQLLLSISVLRLPLGRASLTHFFLVV